MSLPLTLCFTDIRHQAQHLVAGQVAEIVVECLEMIDVGQQQRQRFVVGDCIRDRFFQRAVEEFPVGQLGERIGEAFGAHDLQVFLQLIDFPLGGEETFFQLLVGDLHDLGGLHQTFDDRAQAFAIFRQVELFASRRRGSPM